MGKVSAETIQITKEKEITPLIEEILAVLRRQLKKNHYRVFLFGSWASLNARTTSDIDIAILGTAPINDITFLNIREEIDNLPTLRGIDIVDLSKADKEFRDAVLEESEELFL